MPTNTHQGRVAGTRWDPGQYLKFSDHRTRPALELLGRIPLAAPEVVYDLGCGSGQITRLIASRWESAKVTGVDSSREMLDKAAAEPGPVKWIEADIHGWKPEDVPALVFSNATLHWVEKHPVLFPRLAGYLAPGGCLAVQMPLSWDAPSHRIMRETLADGGAGGASIGPESLRQAVAVKWVEDTAVYYEVLSACTRSLDIWETEYLQILEGADPVLEWVKSTGLRPILNGLDDESRQTFLAEYRRRLREAYPQRPDGRTLYPFRRLFIVATV
jgi:trans-aconitate 2-methyltransferase